jgi:hypothetical protein
MRRNAIFSWLASMHNVNHLFSLRSFSPQTDVDMISFQADLIIP